MTIITDVPQSGPPNPSNWPPWASWFKQVFLTCFSVQDSGTTAQRPSNLAADKSKLWVGRRYFDTTIDQPVWYDGTTWVTWSTGGGGQGNIQIQDDGVDVGTAGQYTTYNFGTGISATQTASDTVELDAIAANPNSPPFSGILYEAWGGMASGGTGPGLPAFTGTTSLKEPVTSSSNNWELFWRTRSTAPGSNQPTGYGGPRALVNKVLWRGNSANLGGFKVYTMLAQVSTPASDMHASFVVTEYVTGSFTVEPSNIANVQGAGFFGIGCDSADTNWQVIRANTGGTSYTKVDTGIAKNGTGVYTVAIYCAPNASGLTVKFQYWSSGTTVVIGTGASDTQYTTNIPSNTTALWYGFEVASATTQLTLDFIYLRTIMPIAALLTNTF